MAKESRVTWKGTTDAPSPERSSAKEDVRSQLGTLPARTSALVTRERATGSSPQTALRQSENLGLPPKE